MEVYATYITDLARMKRESNNTAVVITNSTLITMHNSPDQQVITNGTIVLKDGVIIDVGRGGEVPTPEGSYIMDVRGGKLKCIPRTML
jgi:imidazolonepropionase-like amidohydrolase